MKLIIKDNKNMKILGRLLVENGQVKFEDGYDADFFSFVEDNLKSGIHDFRDDVEGTEKKHLITTSWEKISPEDPRFGPAFYKFLLRRGYNIYEIDSKTDAEIKNRLEKYPEDNPDKKRILASLDGMPRL